MIPGNPTAGGPRPIGEDGVFCGDSSRPVSPRHPNPPPPVLTPGTFIAGVGAGFWIAVPRSGIPKGDVMNAWGNEEQTI